MGCWLWDLAEAGDMSWGADAAPAHLDILFRQVIVDDFRVALTAALEGNSYQEEPSRGSISSPRQQPQPGLPQSPVVH